MISLQKTSLKPRWRCDNIRAFLEYGEIYNWDVTNVTDMSNMLDPSSNFNGDISSWDVSNVTDMNMMFGYNQSFNQDLSSWDVSSVTNMNSMFSVSIFNGDISNWDMTNVIDISNMFAGNASFNGDISNWDVSSVTDMSTMFYATSFNQDISSWDVSNVTKMYSMFYEAASFNGDISNWDVSSVTNMSTMFHSASSFNQDISSWDISGVTSQMNNMFEGSSTLSEENRCSIHASFISNNNWPYEWSSYCFQPQTTDELRTAVELWVSDETSAVQAYGEINTWDVSNVTDMENMFDDAYDFNGDLSSWDVSNVTDMKYMFYNAGSFNGDLSSWDVSNVTDMESMFDNAYNFNGDLSSWDVSSVQNMENMFDDAHDFIGDLSSWDVSNVTDMQYMFYNARSFNGDLSSWDVSNVTDMQHMFDEAQYFNGDLSSWDVSSVQNMDAMFMAAYSFNADISSWDVSNVTTMMEIFYGHNNNELSSNNKCAIHTSWSSNDSWGYDWDVFCNHVPEISFLNDTLMNEDSELLRKFVSIDVDNDELTYTTWSDTSSVTSTVIQDSLLIILEQNWYGVSTVYLRASDGQLSDTLKFNLVVNPVNDKPVLTALNDTTILEDEEIYRVLSSSDIDSDESSYSAWADSSSIFADVVDDSLFIGLAPNWNGSTDIYYSVSDGQLSDTLKFNLVVEPVDDDIMITSSIEDLYLYEDFTDTTITSTLTMFEDIDGELFFNVYVLDTTLASTSIDQSGDIMVQSKPNRFGVTDIIVSASNPTRGMALDTLMLSILPVNDKPNFDMIINDITLDEDSDSLIIISAIDIDSDFLNYYVESDTSAIMVEIIETNENTILDTAIKIHLENNWYGSGLVTVFVEDDSSDVDSLVFQVNVQSINDAPVFTSELELITGVGSEFSYSIESFDVESQNTTISLSFDDTNPDWVFINDDVLTGIAPALGIYDIILELTDDEIVVVDTFRLIAEVFEPIITAISDIPDDQGGRVYLGFSASYYDSEDETGQEYGIYRYDTQGDTSDWVTVASGPAIHQEYYIFEVTTLGDSTSENNEMAIYKVVASMNDGIFHSDPDSGYSIDNIAPGIPQGLLAMANVNTVLIDWEVSEAEDFQYFILERSLSTSFIEENTISMELVETSYLDEIVDVGTQYYYRVRAVDYAGNIGDNSDAVTATALSVEGSGVIPTRYALRQNYPNPFNPTTQINYDLPENTFVSIIIYDVMGRKIKSLLNDNQDAGYRSLQWNATNDLGQPVSAGMYIYTIQAGEFRSTKKMVLLK